MQQNLLINIINQVTVSQTVIISIMLMFISVELTIGVNKSLSLLFNYLFKPLKSDKIVFDKIEALIYKNDFDPIDYFAHYVIGNPLNTDMAFHIHEICDELTKPHYNFYRRKMQKLKNDFHIAIYRFSNIISINTTSGEFWKPWNEPGWTQEKDDLAKEKMNEFNSARKNFLKAYENFVKGANVSFRNLE